MQIIGLGFVVKYTYAQGQVTKSEDMPRPDARGRGRGRGQLVEAEAEPRTKFRPRGQSGLEDLTSLVHSIAVSHAVD